MRDIYWVLQESHYLLAKTLWIYDRSKNCCWCMSQWGGLWSSFMPLQYFKQLWRWSWFLIRRMILDGLISMMDMGAVSFQELYSSRSDLKMKTIAALWYTALGMEMRSHLVMAGGYWLMTATMTIMRCRRGESGYSVRLSLKDFRLSRWCRRRVFGIWSRYIREVICF